MKVPNISRFIQPNHQRQDISVLRRHVQYCLISSLIAPVHWEVCSLSKRSWPVQPITEQSYSLQIQLRFA